MSKRYIKKIQKNNKSNMKQRYNYLQLLNAIKLEQFDIKHSKFLDNNNLLWKWDSCITTLVSDDNYKQTVMLLDEKYSDIEILDITFIVVPPKESEIIKDKALQNVIEKIEMLYMDLYIDLDNSQGCLVDCDAHLEMLNIYKSIITKLGGDIDDDFQRVSKKWHQQHKQQNQKEQDKDKILELMHIPILDLVAMDDKQLSNHLIDIYKKINDICRLLRDKYIQ